MKRFFRSRALNILMMTGDDGRALIFLPGFSSEFNSLE